MVFPLLYIWKKLTNQLVLAASVVMAFVCDHQYHLAAFQFRQNLPCQFIAGGVDYVDHIVAYWAGTGAASAHPNFLSEILAGVGEKFS